MHRHLLNTPANTDACVTKSEHRVTTEHKTSDEVIATDKRLIMQVAVPSPLNRTFDYLAPVGCNPGQLQPGMRLRVPFGSSTRVALIMSISDTSDIAPDKLKAALDVLDESPVIPADLLQLLNWASRYYHHPPGNVISNALPALLRQGQAAATAPVTVWQLNAAGKSVEPDSLSRAPRQRELLLILQKHPEGIDAQTLQALGSWRPALKNLIDKGWVDTNQQHPDQQAAPTPPAHTDQINRPHTLNPDQQRAVDAVTGSLDTFQPFLLDGITGSGKTEVYFRIIEAVLARNEQALMLVPEIGLTPQLVMRVQQHFAEKLVVLHSALSDRERLDAWLATRNGQARIIIGTRSAVFVPFKQLGIIIIDEEHDASFKQLDGFRYHARDIAIVRAQNAGVPIVLGSATPSLESLYNAEQGRYQLLAMKQRVGEAQTPSIRLLDVRHLAFNDGLSTKLLESVQAHLANDNQVLLFLNRRGFAPTMLCHDCGWLARCDRCDAHMIYHQQRKVLRCHHCDAQRPLEPNCPECGSEALLPVGHGTERIEESLRQHFPDTDIIRIDRDSTRRKGQLQSLLHKISSGKRQILLGTQMLAKGHHLPNVTLVAIISADQGLFSIDFRASERLGQMVIQVAGRAGRADKPGEVLIQTLHPENPLLQTLLHHDYALFARQLLAERKATHLPPYRYMAILRADATTREMPMTFLQSVAQLAASWPIEQVEVMGPIPAAMERRAGRYRSMLVIQSIDRKPLHRVLASLAQQIDALPLGRKVRWSLDIDPIDMY